MVPQQEPSPEVVGELATDPGTARFLFIAESRQKDVLSMPMVEDKSGDSEVELIGMYIIAMAERTGREPKEILRDVITYLDDGGEHR